MAIARSAIRIPTAPDGLGRTGGSYVVPWKGCIVCRKTDDVTTVFKSPREFCRHLREYHCTKEGGSFVCHYGPNGVCPSLPIEGVSDQDYEDHVARDHVAADSMSPASTPASPDMREHRKFSTGRMSLSSSSPLPSSSSSVPSVVQDQHRWTVFMSQVNLPAALNDPRLARRETDFFSKTWGESFERAEVVPSPYVPHITKEHFRKYLTKTSRRQHAHGLAAKNMAAAGSNSNGGTESDREQPSNHARKQSKFQVDLEVIPKMFMHPGFSLQNPETFNQVFPWSQIRAIRPDQPEKSGTSHGQSSKLLQEKLSHYLDLVEVQITRQISMRSEAFFSAMISHEELEEHMKRTCAVIEHLRGKVHHLDSILVQNPLKILQMSRTRSNYLKVYKKLKLMATIYQTQPTIQRLLGTNDFIGALDLIATTQEILAQELVGIQCFRHLGLQLMEMEKLIERMMREDFIHVTTSHFNQPITEEQPTVDQDPLVMLILGILRHQNNCMIEICEEEACTSIRAIVKQTVIEAVSVADDIDADSASNSLANQMRLLNYSQWMALLERLFENLVIILTRVKLISDIIQDVAKAVTRSDFFQLPADDRATSVEPVWHQTILRITSDADKILSDVEYLQISKALRDMMSRICDHSHDRCLKVLNARAKDGFLDRLSPGEFVQLSHAIEAFVTNSASLTGRRSVSLRSSLQSQSSKFVNRFHEERISKMSLILDNERWRQADVPVDFQQMVDHISRTGKLRLPMKKTEADSKPQDCLFVDGEKFSVVGTVLMLLKMVVEYCQFIDDIPSATPEILNRLVELLKMFNSRTCQLIIGAGALHLVGLKTISTKNLGLASRCLQVIVWYLPIVKNHFESHLTGKQVNMLKHFEQLLKDYSDHIAMISAKLVSIMDAMFETNLGKYEVKAPVPSTCFRNIVKQIAKFHEAISDLLPAYQIQELFEEINAGFKRVLRVQLMRLSVTSDGGPQHGLVMSDIAFYVAGIRALDGFVAFNANMDDVWDKS